jgi:hypothetical protein
MPEAAEILTEALGRPIAFAQTPIEKVRQYSKDMAVMLQRFERVGYSADIAGLEREFGLALTKLPDWHAATGDRMGAETKEPMVDLTSHGVSSGDVIVYCVRRQSQCATGPGARAND